MIRKPDTQRQMTNQEFDVPAIDVSKRANVGSFFFYPYQKKGDLK
jgi:hypothetical protein